MNKKLISLVLANIMLIELCGVNVFAEDRGQEFTGKTTKKVASSYGKYCEEVPRNAYNMSTEVECAIEEKLPIFKHKDKPLLIIDNVGPTGDINVILCKYSGLYKLLKNFDKWLKEEHTEKTRNQFISSFSDGTKKLFGIKDEESVNIIANFLKKNNYWTQILEIESDDIRNWIKDAVKFEKEFSKNSNFILKGTGIGVGAGAATGYGIHAALAFSAKTAVAKVAATGAVGSIATGVVLPILPFLVAGAAVLGAGGYALGCYLNSNEKTEIEKKLAEMRENEEKNSIKLDVYSFALEDILDSILRNEWIGNDLLIGEMDFGKNSHKALTYFSNVGVSDTHQKNITQLFKNFSESLSNLTKKYNITKGEL